MIHPTKKDELDQHLALPQKCPCCKQDWSRRQFVKSPVRSFRAGFGKISQVLVKEMIYQLDHDPAGGNPRKLVAFSDSREDAARLAFDIEDQHYLNTVEELMMQIFRNSQRERENAHREEIEWYQELVEMVAHRQEKGKDEAWNAYSDHNKEGARKVEEVILGLSTELLR